MIGECKGPGATHSHIFGIQPGFKPTKGMSSENIVISNAPEHLQLSGKTEDPFDLFSQSNTKIFKYNCNVY